MDQTTTAIDIDRTNLASCSSVANRVYEFAATKRAAALIKRRPEHEKDAVP